MKALKILSIVRKTVGYLFLSVIAEIAAGLILGSFYTPPKAPKSYIFESNPTLENSNQRMHHPSPIYLAVRTSSPRDNG